MTNPKVAEKSDDKGTDTYYVDIPSPYNLGSDDYSWINLKTFDNRKDALKWIRENIGPCDDEGKISLIVP